MDQDTARLSSDLDTKYVERDLTKFGNFIKILYITLEALKLHLLRKCNQN